MGIVGLLRRLRFDVRKTPNPLPRLTHAEATHLLYFKRMLSLVSDIEGDVVECGVGRGHSLLAFAILLRDEEKVRNLWGFDSFAGFPAPTEEDHSPRNPRAGEWAVASRQDVHRLLLQAGLDPWFVDTRVVLVEGFFQDTLPHYRGRQIALLHLDVDLYASYRSCLTHLWPKVAVGGVVLFDEYRNTMENIKFPGAAKAIDEFFGAEASRLRRDESSGKFYLVRTKS
ncbi:MAG TPA: TylF/MycF/NovP-related O-methyltransferase [bacterium]|jgi:O-methyltransferase|nr:TylF/MycF/NovP-related O-methyltransferase [bacterium]